MKKKTLTWKKFSFLTSYLLLGIVIASSLFFFEFLEDESDNTVEAKRQAVAAKKINSKELARIKDYVKHHNPELYAQYLQANKEFLASKKFYSQAKEKDKFLGFSSYKSFAYNFFPVLLLFFYVVYHFYLTTKRGGKKLGIKLIHAVFLLYLSTRLYWVFQPAVDLSKGEYYVLAVITTVLVSFSVWLFHKKELAWSKKVKKKLFKVSYYAMVNCEEDRAEDMAKIIEQPIE